MAQRLNVSSAFLSRVEHGDSKPPKHWKQQIIEAYKLEDNLEEFEECFNDAISGGLIDISSFSEKEKHLIRLFIKKIHGLDKTTLSNIYSLLSEEKELVNENSNYYPRNI